MSLKKIAKEIWRKPYQMHLRRKLKVHDFCLISCNCIGAVLSHDLGEQFRSPTVNLTVKPFLPFIQNLEYHMSISPVYIGQHEKQGYPICKLGDITINGVHYHEPNEMIATWEKRKKRIDQKRIFVIATDEYIRTEEELEQFARLPYPKVLFTSKPTCRYDFEAYIPGFETEACVGDILRYEGIFGARKFEKYFDCVKWLNENSFSNE